MAKKSPDYTPLTESFAKAHGMKELAKICKATQLGVKMALNHRNITAVKDHKKVDKSWVEI